MGPATVGNRSLAPKPIRLLHLNLVLAGRAQDGFKMPQADSNPFSNIFSPQPWDSQSLSQGPRSGDLDEPQTPPILNPIESLQDTPIRGSSPQLAQPAHRRFDEGCSQKLRFLRLNEWDKNKSYNKNPPTWIHYLVVWSALLNRKEFLRDSQPNLVLNPGDYWRVFLQGEVEGLVQEKLGNQSADHIMVNVSAGRSARKLVKRFRADIDWHLIENQLIQWSELFRAGKDLRVDIAFHYVQASQTAMVSSS